MNRYSILIHRKRAVIALIHAIAFGLLATYQFASAQQPKTLVAAQPGHLAGPLAMTAIYSVVSAVLWVLVKFSRAGLERLYFLFCATSASVGFLRVTVGDPTLRVGSLIRVLMLLSAVVTGILIVREHGTSVSFVD